MECIYCTFTFVASASLLYDLKTDNVKKVQDCNHKIEKGKKPSVS